MLHEHDEVAAREKEPVEFPEVEGSHPIHFSLSRKRKKELFLIIYLSTPPGPNYAHIHFPFDAPIK